MFSLQITILFRFVVIPSNLKADVNMNYESSYHRRVIEKLLLIFVVELLIFDILACESCNLLQHHSIGVIRKENINRRTEHIKMK